MVKPGRRFETFTWNPLYVTVATFAVIISESNPWYGRISRLSTVLVPGSAGPGFVAALMGPAKFEPATPGAMNSGLNAVPGAMAFRLKSSGWFTCWLPMYARSSTNRRKNCRCTDRL